MTITTHKLITIVAATLVAITALTGCSGENEPVQHDPSTKAERNFIRSGNKLFDDKNYAEAEIEYSKALQANPNSATAAYNLALALAMQAEPNDSTGIIERADSLFSYAASITSNKQLKAMAHYNMGNMAYNNNQFDKAINDYKDALRVMPGDDDARYNLRMAQLKQQQQQNQQNQDQNQDKDQNQDQNQDKNQDQNQDQNQQNQDQQNQDQQNQQNQDQQKQQDKQNQQQDQQQNQQQNQQDKNNGSQGQQQARAGKMDERSMQQVLKAMEDKEKETQQKIYQMGERQRELERRHTQNKW